MESSPQAAAALSVALALAAGTFTPLLARHLRIPGIVLLMGAASLWGPTS